jgi:hypothetical protein
MEGELGLLGRRDRPRLHAEQLRRASAERVSASGVAHRAGAHHVEGRHAHRAQLFGVAPEARERARDGLGGERACPIDALTEARDGRALDERDDAVSRRDLGDEEQDGVGPDVDGRDAHEVTTA